MQNLLSAKYDAICHLAAQIDVRKSVADPAFDASVNVGGTLNLVEAVRQSDHPTRFVFSSTGGAIYGDFVDVPTEERASKDPESPYGIAKLSAEYYLAYYARVHGLDTVALRYSNVYGPRQNPHGEAGVVAIFCSRILENKPLTVYGEGTQTRSFCYVSDLISGIVALLEAEPTREIETPVNIGNPGERTVRDLAELVLKLTGSSSTIVNEPLPVDDPKVRCPDSRRAQTLLGWKPEFPVERGVALTIEYFKRIVGS